jgi:Chlorophyll A-B binding protein
MKTIIIASLIASASAFAPVSNNQRQSTTSVVLKASPFANEIGAQAPLGFWDPLGYATDAETFERLRYVELKHGRIAMLAVVGYLVTYAGIRFPGAEDIPSGFAALSALPSGVVVQMAFTLGVMEAFNRDASDIWDVKKGDFPGDFRNGFIDFGWDKQTDAWKKNKRAIELNQGRAAQMGIFGLMVHDQLGNVADILPSI